MDVVRLAEFSDPARSLPEVEAIFFEASGIRQFESEAARAAFRGRWLGRYLDHYPNESFVALTSQGAVAGYLVGCLEDPARNALFSDISYFSEFADLTAHYPAHLHINVAADFRGRGIGARLIEAFAAHAARAGAPGMHVVTGEGARNNRFYLALGFRKLATTAWNGKQIAFLGRAIAAPSA